MLGSPYTWTVKELLANDLLFNELLQLQKGKHTGRQLVVDPGLEEDSTRPLDSGESDHASPPTGYLTTATSTLLDKQPKMDVFYKACNQFVVCTVVALFSVSTMHSLMQEGYPEGTLVVLHSCVYVVMTIIFHRTPLDFARFFFPFLSCCWVTLGLLVAKKIKILKAISSVILQCITSIIVVGLLQSFLEAKVNNHMQSPAALAGEVTFLIGLPFAMILHILETNNPTLHNAIVLFTSIAMKDMNPAISLAVAIFLKNDEAVKYMWIKSVFTFVEALAGVIYHKSIRKHAHQDAEGPELPELPNIEE